MKLKIEKMKWITREIVQSNPGKVFLFGDNLCRWGMGGQAGAMRGEPNANGIATKISPGSCYGEFFTDDHFQILVVVIRGDIRLAVDKAKTLEGVIVIPEDGLGTGLADLPNKAPQIFQYLEERLAELETRDY